MPYKTMFAVCVSFLLSADPQVQYSLLDTRPENGMADFCAAHNMWLLPYGVLAGGFLSKRYLGVPAAEVRADTYRWATSYVVLLAL